MPISEETFFLDPRYEGSLQSQIQQMVAGGILSGRFRSGEKMPSSRKLAAHLGVSRITVTHAYAELMADDYLTSRGRSGYYISENAPPPSEIPARQSGENVDWSRAISRPYSGIRQVDKPEGWQGYRYPFVYGQADPTLFDQQNWRLCALQALGKRDFDTLTGDYADRDDPQLVEFITRHALPRRGILARPEEVLITAGAQNALWLTAQILLGQRRRAGFEDPCYPGLREVLAQTRCHLAPVEVDAKGIMPWAMRGGIDVLFTTPSHQCPTTATLPVERREALLGYAKAEDFLIVEDDYEFEMSFLNKPSPALKSLDEDGRVIYVGSFSKSLFPGLRLGYLVGAEPFIREARALRSTVLRHIPGHIQRTTAYFLSRGHYDALVRRLRDALHRRRLVMEEAIKDNRLTIAGASQFGGSSYWMATPRAVDIEARMEALMARGVLIEPGTPFFEDPEQGKGFYRLAYSSIPAERISEGIGILAEELRR